MNTREQQLKAFERLLDVMDELRAKCPWDRKQTFESLRENTIEETYELASAITGGDMTEIRKELGDVLLHVVFYAKMGSEQGEFDIADVCNSLCDKLIFRHPHVYGVKESAKYGNISIPDADKMTPQEVEHLWEQVKQKEKGGNKTVLAGVPDSLPALIKAYRIQEKAANVGFDWKEKEDVWAKVKEEVAELEQELRQTDNRERQEAELGDVIFSLVNAARLYKLRPDNALEKTNKKFIRRFNYIEQKAKEKGQSLSELTLDEMETLWQQAKQVTD